MRFLTRQHRHASASPAQPSCVLHWLWGLAILPLGACDRSASEKPAPPAPEVSVVETAPPAPAVAPEPPENTPPPRPTPTGQFLAIEGKTQRSFRLADFVDELAPRVVESDDPYYQRMKRFWAVPSSALLTHVFQQTSEQLLEATLIVRAKDGFVVHFSGPQLLDAAAYFAFADAEHKDFVPIGEQKADPAPLYLVWEGERSELTEYPRPWGLASIELAKKDAGLEHTIPEGGFGDNALAERGNVLFKQECIRCHSINQQGGKVGPDLNVPQNILEYRPEAQVKQYIRDPKTFRYSNMPPHLDLSDADLNALIAYLKLMGQHQIDPRVDSTPDTAHDHD